MNQIEKKDELTPEEEVAIKDIIEDLCSEGLISNLKAHSPGHWEKSDELIKRVIWAYYKNILLGEKFNLDALVEAVCTALKVKSITPRLVLNIARTIHVYLVGYLRKQNSSIGKNRHKERKSPAGVKTVTVSYWTREVMEYLETRTKIHDDGVLLQVQGKIQHALGIIVNREGVKQGKKFNLAAVFRQVWQELKEKELIVKHPNDNKKWLVNGRFKLVVDLSFSFEPYFVKEEPLPAPPVPAEEKIDRTPLIPVAELSKRSRAATLALQVVLAKAGAPIPPDGSSPSDDSASSSPATDVVPGAWAEITTAIKGNESRIRAWAQEQRRSCGATINARHVALLHLAMRLAKASGEKGSFSRSLIEERTAAILPDLSTARIKSSVGEMVNMGLFQVSGRDGGGKSLLTLGESVQKVDLQAPPLTPILEILDKAINAK